jgi:putative redox protein
MELIVEHLGAVQFEITARGHRVISDQPEELGGDNEGMTPPELLLGSLGSCAAYYAVDYLKRKKLLVNGTRVRVSADKIKPTLRAGQPLTGARVDNFQIEVEVPLHLTEEQHRGLEDAVHNCLIKNTLLTPPSISLAIRSTVGTT